MLGAEFVGIDHRPTELTQEGLETMASLHSSFSRMVEEPLDGRDKVTHLERLALKGVVASPVMWKRGKGAFFRLMKCTTSQPPRQAATGGTRHGEAHQQVGRSA